MTEDEAKTKWCPFARRLFDWNEETSYNRRKDDSPGSLCIASACMAWRRVETLEFKNRAEAEFRRNGKRIEPDTGFCGLAGSPQ